jgi:hexosaminidase
MLAGTSLPRAAVDPGGPERGLVPQPVRVESKGGTWALARSTRLVARDGARPEADALADALAGPLGWRLPVVEDAARDGDIQMVLAAGGASAGPEGYRLSVTPRGVVLRAGDAAGLFYGGVTLRQLLPPAVFGGGPSPAGESGSWPVACVEIEDAPRFGWRGLLLDPARHFWRVEFIKRFVDLMALHKFNRLQLHLTDDQGWRFEVKKHPRLTQIGSVRRESPRAGNRDQGDGVPYGPFFYSQDELRDLIAYAGRRHVVLVPEIELPGHFLAAVAAYPELSCRGQPVSVRTRWGIEPDILCAGNDAAIAFARDILDEVCAVFPGPFVHIGGDEAPRDRWKACPKCQARIKAEGLKNEAELQTWLNRRLEEFLASKGRRLIGWDEILEGGLTPGAAVMSWRGMEGGVAAAEAGHDVVMAPTSHCYFDYAQGRGPDEPESIGGFIPLETVYGFEPVPARLAVERRRHILGVQGALWGEYLRTPRDVEYFAFPRALALAEVAWSRAGARDYAGFKSRLTVHFERLDRLGVQYRRPTPAGSF